MPMQFKCDSCGKSLKADESKAGKRVKCPNCSEAINIPKPDLVIEDYEELETNDDDSEVDDFPPPPRRSPKRKVAKRRSVRQSSSEYSLASPWKRLAGAFGDYIAGILLLAPGFLATGFVIAERMKHPRDPWPSSYAVSVCVLVLGFVLLAGLNAFMYATRSQSLGKWMAGTQVLNYDTDEPAGLVRGFLCRGFISGFFYLIPTIGQVYFVADQAFVLADEHRCLHDRIAGTYVVNIS
jgi:uncharacterized RDD family membrane protein YckC/phage FluMu protein Com